MENVNIILNNKKYKQALKKIEEYEKDREFCNHTIEHFMDVSRIAYIMILEENLNVSKEIVYAIGLLHDIGRVKQYEEGIHHDIASVEISREILKETSFTKNEINIILNGIANHRKESDNKLEEIIYKADKLSRQCFNCKAEKECYWSSEKKNFKITY
ncbi:HD domain-containing protein [uncultured Clostridium sp.]|uniref:HD domain-containing protein n=1 Tax=uncultured Clostridium sp. TaxID=59620 RepID=UPI0025E9564B|nr:HD domain-containing protein [uncultured Clostridium sp.]